MISYYKNLITEQERRKKRFNNLKSNLNGSVVPALTKICNDLLNSSQSLKSGFSVDGEGADGESIVKNFSSVSNLKSTISGSVMSEIEAEISKCNSNISYYSVKVRELLEEQEKE